MFTTEIADKVVDGFNFEKILNHMISTEWKWQIKGELKIPTLNDLKATATYLTTSLALSNAEIGSMMGSGGFMVYVIKTNDGLGKGMILTFQLASSSEFIKNF
ncbi:hypothetical protein [Flavobacterium sp.]|jgi:hypothetical protein|uniref:hypothetical protein n=1 Tax=Flavobacterium sp. TaxID=239 RepID=UPI0037C16D7E